MLRAAVFFVAFLLINCDNNSPASIEMPTIKLVPVNLDEEETYKIAVIGSGIAGASYVHFLNQAASKNCHISVFEKENRLGGRVKKDSLGGGLIEQGATLIHSSNYYLKDIIDSYALEYAKPHGGEGEAETLAIWDGSDFRLNTSQSSFLSSIQMLWAYGMSLSDLSKLVKKLIPKWKQAYIELGKGISYDTPDNLFKAIGLYELTQQKSYDYFKQEGIADDLVYEFIDCISRVNYHQDGNINAFTDMVSLAGAGLDGGELFSVDGGNDLMVQSILSNKPNVNIRLNEEVVSVKKLLYDGKQMYEVATKDGQQDSFDIVVLACPLDLTNIELQNYAVKKDRSYETVHANFIAGDINYEYFNNVKNKPQTIFTIEDENIPFVSIAKTSFATDWDITIYKVFSRDALDDTFFDQVFKNRKGQAHHEWKAYTTLSPMNEWPPFKIDDGLYYINAMESAVSTMETEAVAARNIVNLSLDFMKREL